ncbi:MAG: hypothetical protein QOD39_5243 [Mycobacterium sp.]|nr:hypothetical protein [Mycobacterium sp.]
MPSTLVEGMHIVRLIRALASAVICAGAVLGFASPAQGQGDVQAPGVPEGVYTVNIDGQASTTWAIQPICVPTVGDLREPLLLPVGCRLKIIPPTGSGAEAVVTGGQWTLVYDSVDGRTCPDGSHAPQKTVYAFDPFALNGTMTVLHGGECNDVPAMVKAPFTLTYLRPLAAPVTEYPLLCEPGGLRRCF